MITQNSKATDRNDLQRYQYRRRVLLFVCILAISACLLFVKSAWTDMRIKLFIQAIGFVLISIGILGRMWCTLYIGGRKSNQVVSDGPYSIMRNPLYFFSSIAAMGVGALTASISLGLLLGAFCVVAFLIVIKREEAFLSGTFGKPYEDYCKKVPQFFPDFKLFTTPETIESSPKRLLNTLLDGLVFYVALPLLGAVAYAQSEGWLPVLLQLY